MNTMNELVEKMVQIAEEKFEKVEKEAKRLPRQTEVRSEFEHNIGNHMFPQPPLGPGGNPI